MNIFFPIFDMKGKQERIAGSYLLWNSQLVRVTGPLRAPSHNSAVYHSYLAQEQACVLEADMLDYIPVCKGVKRLLGQGHRLRLAFSSITGLCLCVYLAIPARGQFIVFQVVPTDNNRYSLEHISSLFTTQVKLLPALQVSWYKPKANWSP